VAPAFAPTVRLATDDGDQVLLHFGKPWCDREMQIIDRMDCQARGYVQSALGAVLAGSQEATPGWKNSNNIASHRNDAIDAFV